MGRGKGRGKGPAPATDAAVTPERAAFLVENAVAVLTELDVKLRRLRREVTKLAASRQDMRQALTQLRAENAALRAALRPFAAYAGRVHESADDRNPVGDACPPAGGPYRPNEMARPRPTLGDCRRAREALGEGKEG